MRLITSQLLSIRILQNALLSTTLLFFAVIWWGCEPKPSPEFTSSEMPEEAITVEIGFDQGAADLLKRGLNYLSELEKFQVTTQQTYEDLMNNQVRIDLETSANLTVSRPEKIRIERFENERHELFLFNGEDFTLNNPDDKVYATEKLKGNLEDMFHTVRDTFGISASAGDLIYKDSYSLMIVGVKGARVIGKERIGDIMCDHLVFVRPDVSYQIWISESEPYLPYKYVVTDTSTSHLLSFSTLMTGWDLDPKISDTMFRYEPTDDTHRIFFMKMSGSLQKSID